MNRLAITLFLTFFAVAGTASATAPDLTVITPGHEHWVEQPDHTSTAILYGDPSKAGLYIMLVKLPPNWSEGAHYHSQRENVTVVAGTAYLGLGKKFDKNAVTAYTAGTFASIPAKTPHYALTKSQSAVLQLVAVGPYQEIMIAGRAM